MIDNSLNEVEITLPDIVRLVLLVEMIEALEG